jgi:hypothetical protein
MPTVAQEQAGRTEWLPKQNALEIEFAEGWMAVEWYERQQGRAVVARLLICPAPPRRQVRNKRTPGEPPTDAVVPTGGVTARLLRQVKVGKYAALAVDDLRAWIEEKFGADALRRLDAHTVRPSRRQPPKPRTERNGDVYYAELARDYSLLCERGISQPTKELGTMRGLPLVRIRSHLHLARANGFLTATSRGRAGGELTTRAREVLAAEAQQPAARTRPGKKV